MTYQLYRVDPLANGGHVDLGVHGTYGRALVAADLDTLALMLAAGGWQVMVEHEVVGPDGCFPTFTSVGVDPRREEPPDLADVAYTVHWLATGP
jgi:hypothetical protein